MSRPRPRWSFSSLTKTTTGRRRRGADDGGADDGAGAVVNSPPLPLRRRRRRRAAPPGQKENVEKDTVAGPAAGPAEPSAMSSAGPLVSWSSACGAMRGHLRTEMRRRQNAIFIDRTSDLYFYFLLLPLQSSFTCARTTRRPPSYKDCVAARSLSSSFAQNALPQPNL